MNKCKNDVDSLDEDEDILDDDVEDFYDCFWGDDDREEDVNCFDEYWE